MLSIMINNTPFGHLVDKVVSLYRSAPTMPYVLFSEMPLTIEMNDRMRTVGGRCTMKLVLGTMVIQLNTQLFATLNDDQRTAIIAHELAHAVVFHLGHVKETHGHIWRSVARAMGDDGSRCHTLEVKKNLVRRVVYAHKTTGKLYVLSIQRMKKHCAPYSDFRTQLTYVGEIEINRNNNTYHWKSLQVYELREVTLLRSEYKLVRNELNYA